ncbi:hypothetical protein [Campylobacter sp. RM12651]|uniref:hypothetical protein n=1 Tax=Campylobacter sp. RM12651 TaxID=1660079 RepID=UPI001EFAB416|nr:hypothetical protein [Campylobacter sp. RM12651]ULO04544.1 putative membrane protein [Campylobacter sp. RM12651]
MFNFLEKIWSYVDIGAGVVFSIIALNFIAFIFLMFAKKQKYSKAKLTDALLALIVFLVVTVMVFNLFEDENIRSAVANIFFVVLELVVFIPVGMFLNLFKKQKKLNNNE